MKEKMRSQVHMVAFARSCLYHEGCRTEPSSDVQVSAEDFRLDALTRGIGGSVQRLECTSHHLLPWRPGLFRICKASYTLQLSRCGSNLASESSSILCLTYTFKCAFYLWHRVTFRPNAAATAVVVTYFRSTPYWRQGD